MPITFEQAGEEGPLNRRRSPEQLVGDLLLRRFPVHPQAEQFLESGSQCAREDDEILGMRLVTLAEYLDTE